MKLNNLRSYALASMQTYDESLRTEKAIIFLEEEVKDEWEELNTADVQIARFENFNIAKTTPDDYVERELLLDENKRVIYGVRHIGANREKAFISFIPNFKFESKKEVLAVYERIKDEFIAFNPFSIRLWSGTNVLADSVGSIYMVENYNHFVSLPAWPEEDIVSFEKVTNNDYYSWYQELYSEFHESCPGLVSEVTLNSRELMQKSLDQGLLCFILVEGKRAGIIAAEKEELLGNSGFYFNEVLLSKAYKGKGLAKAIQRKFIVNFATEGNYIWGTIDHKNQASLRTSLRNKRKIVRYECFVKL